MDRLVVDDWGQCKGGKLGALRAHVEAGKLSEATLHGELGEIVTGKQPGRERADETILFRHRGLSLSDIALGAALLENAAAQGLAQSLRYASPRCIPPAAPSRRPAGLGARPSSPGRGGSLNDQA